MLTTEQVLRDIFKHDEQYIAKFMCIAKKANVDSFLDKLLLGQVDSKVAYTSDEQSQIIETLTDLVEQQFSKVEPDKECKKYRSSGGAPGSGKTFALEKMYHINVASNQFPENAIYIGPDSVVLPQMKAFLSYCADPKLGQAAAYTKWRDASNFIANFMLIKSIADGVNIVHDTTLTSPKIKYLLDILSKEGYHKEVHFFIADKDAREKAIIHRKEKLGLTVTPEDVVSKAEAAYERLSDHTYEGRIDQYTLYAQKGEFYLGNGETTAFAVYNPKQNAGVQILADGETHVEHFLDQATKQENLKFKLLDDLHEFVKTWIKAPKAKDKATPSYTSAACHI